MPIEIELRQGDIAQQPDLDAVVNAANTELWMGAGVAGALKRRGGQAIEDEAVRQGPIALGAAVITSAGELPNRWVNHCAAMGYRPEDEALPKRAGSRSSAAIIAACVARALELCDEHGVRTIGFPALATGVGALPVEECAAAMIGAVHAYAAGHLSSELEGVAFILRGEGDLAAFAGALAG